MKSSRAGNVNRTDIRPKETYVTFQRPLNQRSYAVIPAQIASSEQITPEHQDAGSGLAEDCRLNE